jgi:hypothetical protein
MEIMRDDLLEPLACVDWTGDETWQVSECEPFPLLIQAEAGAIINSLRSALDVLANKLAERNGHLGKKDVYFPVCGSSSDFEGRGRKKIKRLSAADQIIIESLQPYHGGDNCLLLFALHNMDNARKHRSLIKAASSAAGFGVYRFGLRPDIDKLMRSRPLDKGYVLARGVADPDCQIQVRIEITLREAGVLTDKEAIGALRELARLVDSIIWLFDTP